VRAYELTFMVETATHQEPHINYTEMTVYIDQAKNANRCFCWVETRRQWHSREASF